MKAKFWLNLFLILAGTVIGNMLSQVAAKVSYLSWLAYGLDFGTSSPVAVELGIVDFTFGISFSLSVATIICIALCLIVGKFLVRK